jgi:peptidoglycan/xylan/chitin deacetylase (PgdA/CDA1 family)
MARSPRRRRTLLLLAAVMIAAGAAAGAFALARHSNASTPAQLGRAEGVVVPPPPTTAPAEPPAPETTVPEPHPEPPIARQVLRAVPNDAAVARAGGTAREIALTFDDGPGALTGRILDELRAGGAHGTFFVIGRQLHGHEEVLRRILAEGHDLGDHTWAHASLLGLTEQQRREQLELPLEALVDATGERPHLFRPPYGATSRKIAAMARRLGLLTIYWSVDCQDYDHATPKRLTRCVLDHAEPGAIVLMHDAGGDRTTTADALPAILKGLEARGLEPVTVSELLAHSPPESSGLVLGRRS